MAVEIFANQPSTVVTSGGTDAPAAGTVESWTVSSSAAFPAASSSASPPTQFHIVDVNVSQSSEIVLVTNVSGTTWTVTRGVEGTTPVTHSANFTIQQVVTAGFFTSTVRLGGDLGNTSVAPEVLKIQGTSISVPSGGATSFLNATGAWSIPAGGGGSAGGAPVAWFNAHTQYDADNTGTTECHADIQSAITAAAAATPGYGVVYLPAGTYLISAGFNLPVNVTLVGDGAVGGTVTGVRTGTVLQLTSGFSGSYVLGIIDGGTESVNGAVIRDLMIYGGGYTAEAVTGIQITGPAMTTLRNLRITQMSGWGINTALNLSASEIGPYGQDWDNILVDSGGTVSGGGISLIYAEDSTFRDIYCIGNNNGPGFQITGCDNSHFSDCRAEWNSTHGFWITDQTISGTTYDWTYATGMCQFSNCSTDRNTEDGVHIDATWTTGAGPGTGPCIIMFTGLVTRRDGAANNEATGTYAGISIDSTNLLVIISGFAQMPSIGDGDSGNLSPRYGVYLTGVGSTVPIILGPGIAWGYTAGIDGTATGLVNVGPITQLTGANYNYTG
jgi:hypothetical protein